jgi:hypothetical protein
MQKLKTYLLQYGIDVRWQHVSKNPPARLPSDAEAVLANVDMLSHSCFYAVKSMAGAEQLPFISASLNKIQTLENLRLAGLATEPKVHEDATDEQCDPPLPALRSISFDDFTVEESDDGVWVTGAARDSSSRATRPVLILGDDGSKALFFSQREAAMFLEVHEVKVSKSLRNGAVPYGPPRALTGVWSTDRLNGYGVKLASFDEVMDNLDVRVDMHANRRTLPEPTVEDYDEPSHPVVQTPAPPAFPTEFTYHLTVNGSVVLLSAYGTLFFNKPDNVPASLLALAAGRK